MKYSNQPSNFFFFFSNCDQASTKLAKERATEREREIGSSNKIRKRGRESDGNEKSTVTTVGRRSGASLLLPLLSSWGFYSSATLAVGQRVRKVQQQK